MEFTKLTDIANYIVSEGKGILAADESNPTCKKRFDTISVESSEENRRDYRELLFTSNGMRDNIGGVILFDETIRQKSASGATLVELILANGALPGIKVDKGLKPFRESEVETLTEGLDDLDERCSEYANLGAKFTKWRAVINIGDGMPTQECIDANMDALAQYAKIAQKNGMVPIVEPEILINGSHSIEDCYDATSRSIKSLFDYLNSYDVDITGTILKPNMVTPGLDSEHKATVKEVAEMTIRCLKESVPDELPGVAFLSGGQTEIESTEHLDMMNKIGGFPWKLSFSYGRALQQSALNAWLGKAENKVAAQAAFAHRAEMNKLASLGQWSADLEN
ncbi:MAG: fructose-bisphosphate aldolase class I [Gammaproteobacteria bacterium]|nr:fructose-bisphosphate aldolase class I [Gammaproteobacteria bacterium]